jgi:Ran GTPase-activating protein (RanGAP) involved in mRNA processing and transport
MTALARALHVNTSITELNLSWNLIRSPGARALAPALAASTTLRELDLGFNLLRCNGAAFLAPAISASPSLRVLSLRRNELGPNGSTHVADALRSNTSLRSLNLGLNGLAALGAAKIGEAIAQNSTLEHMDLDWNALRELGLHVLTSGLRNKCGLTFLDLSHNKLSHESARNLASALKSLALSRQRQREGLDSRRACSAAALPCLHATSVQLNCSHPCVDGCLVGAAHGRGAGSGERGKRFGGGAGSGQGMEDGGDEVLSGRDESKHDDTGTRAQQRACRDLYATDGEGLFRAPYVADAASSWSPPTAGVVSVADTAGAVRGTEEVVVWADDAVRSQDGDVTSSGFDAGLGRVRRESLPLVLVRGNNLRPEGLAMMLPVLRADALRVLDLCDNDLRDRGCHLLARHGADLLWSLRGLNMSGNSITSKGLEVLASVLNGSTLLEELKVSRNDIQVCLFMYNAPALSRLLCNPRPAKLCPSESQAPATRP